MHGTPYQTQPTIERHAEARTLANRNTSARDMLPPSVWAKASYTAVTASEFWYRRRIMAGDRSTMASSPSQADGKVRPAAAHIHGREATREVIDG